MLFAVQLVARTLHVGKHHLVKHEAAGHESSDSQLPS